MASNPDFWWWTHPFFPCFSPSCSCRRLGIWPGRRRRGGAVGAAWRTSSRRCSVTDGMGWDGKAGGKTRVFGGKATEKLKKTWVNLSTVTIGAWPAWLCFNFCFAWKWWKWSEPSMWSGTLNGAARFLWLVIFLFPSLGKVTHVHLGMAPIRVSP